MESSLHEKESLEINAQEKLQHLLNYVKDSAGKEEIHIVEKEILRYVTRIVS